MSENHEASLQKNKDIVSRFYREVLNEGKLDLIDEICAPDYTVEIEDPETGEPMFNPQGKKNLKEAIVELRNAFPDFRITIEDQIAEGDRVATVYVFRGTNKAQYGSFGPTDELEIRSGVKLDTVREGKIVAGKQGRRWFG